MTESVNITIMYVDDEEINIIVFESIFRKRYKVITAASPIEGLEKLKYHKNDIIVVISDMKMPGMNGIEFIRKAREQFDNIAYFILSGFDFNDEIREALNTKLIYKFLRKPFDFDEIIASIDEAVSNLKLI
jgi:two-component system response regulator (stage 0 sporulation protein F)